MNLASNDDDQGVIIYKDLLVYKQGTFAPKQTQGPFILISKFKFL